MHNFAHKESEYRCCPSRGPVAAMHHQDPPGAKAMGGPLATWLASMDPSRRERTNQGLERRKTGKEIETGEVRREEEVKKKKVRGV